MFCPTIRRYGGGVRRSGFDWYIMVAQSIQDSDLFLVFLFQLSIFHKESNQLLLWHGLMSSWKQYLHFLHLQNLLGVRWGLLVTVGTIRWILCFTFHQNAAGWLGYPKYPICIQRYLLLDVVSIDPQVFPRYWTSDPKRYAFIQSCFAEYLYHQQSFTSVF